MIDPLKSLPGYALRRASAAMLGDLATRLAPLDLRATEAAIVVLIEANPGITQSELCRALDVQRANMTPLIARLDHRGLVARTAVDGRSQGLALTPAGLDLHRAVRVAMDAHETGLVDRIPAPHRAAFMAALAALWGD